MLPDFLIVGAMKAGTTTLAYHLGQHPDVFLPDREIHFFDDDSHYRRGIQWYEDRFEGAGEGQVVGEKTPTYSYLPIVPPRIAKDLPNVKLIWIFRDPVARAYSNYWHAVRQGVERFSFEKAIARENKRLRKSRWYGYRKRSVYAEQVERYLHHFARPRMCFIFLEELIDRREHEQGHVLDFLSVRDHIHSSELERRNQTILPRSIYLQWLARQVFGVGRAFRIITRLNSRRRNGYPQIDQDVREELEAYFAPFNAELFSLIGRTTDKW